MDRALLVAATGMAAQQSNLETIADNLANADVVGFKGSAQRFAELVAPGGNGLGTVALGPQVLFGQGKLARSGGPFDLAIDGPGFFALRDDHGRRVYSRNGQFSRAADGTLRTSENYRLDGVSIPREVLSATVGEDGKVTAKLSSGTRIVGHIGIATFAAPELLRPLAGNYFEATTQSGPARSVEPGTHDGPSLRFGMLEQSNVTIVDAMMQILTAQRAYEANAKGVQAADEMLRIANNLQRG
jgi:flagellar basal-body rod protein FlgG